MIKIKMNRQPSRNKIINTVANFYDIKRKDLVGNRRKKELVKARQIAMYFLREILKESYPKIGKVIGNKDHTTAIHAYKKIKMGSEKRDELREELEVISGIINAEELKTLLKPVKTQEIISVVSEEKKEVPQLERIIETLRKEPASFVVTEREKSMLEEWRAGNTLEKIGKEWKVTRERIRQIISRAILREAARKMNEGFEIDVEEFLRQEKNQHKNIKEKLNDKINLSDENRINKSKRWSRFYARCRQCGTTIIPHRSRGLCQKCYGIVIDREEKIKKRGEKCEHCGTPRNLAFKEYGRDLYVMRVNKNGEGFDYLVLCRRCFLKIMGKKLGNSRQQK
jgi:ribosomal protein S14/DNA-binding CsgD family transcriptional regulator